MQSIEIEQYKRFALLAAPEMLELREEPLSQVLPRPDFVRLKVDYCGICGGDIATYHGRSTKQYPNTLGHEYFGTVIAVGKSVSHFKVGDWVAVDPNYRCGQCKYCKIGMSNFCISSGINLFNPRGLSNVVDIHYSYLQRIPDFAESYLGALIEPLSCALHSLKLSGAQEDDRILVLGAGGQGSLLTFALSVYFPDTKIEVYDPNIDRIANLQSALQGKVYPRSDVPPASMYSLIFEASGQTTGFEYATRSIQQSGRVVVISRYRDQNVQITPEIPRKGCALLFSHLNGDGNSFVQAMHLLSACWQDEMNRLFLIDNINRLSQIFETVEHSPYAKTIVQTSTT